MKNFQKVLINTLLANVTTSYLWFALTFWIYLETKSVLATSVIGGSYLLLVAMFSLYFGTIVDRHKKKWVMVVSSAVTLSSYLLAALIFISTDKSNLLNWHSALFWMFGGIILVGAVVENMRNIALSTTVTLLVPKSKRDKANGQVGVVQGMAYFVTSVFSGISIGFLGMGWTLSIAILLTGVALFHLNFVHIPEKHIKHDPELANKKIDLQGARIAIKVVPGLIGLIFFTTFNNFVGGVYDALMDPYGLTLFRVEVWGTILAIISLGFILGGFIVSKKGLGKSPLKVLLIVNALIGLVSMMLAIREVKILYILGLFTYMSLYPVVEAAEQTVIQRVVPFERQGRVFGLAQSIESAASPLTIFAIGPMAQFWLIPYMNSAAGKTRFGWLIGSGHARGMALIFFFSGLIALAAALLAFKTKAYKKLSIHYSNS